MNFVLYIGHLWDARELNGATDSLMHEGGIVEAHNFASCGNGDNGGYGGGYGRTGVRRCQSAR
jgi:hypothetical protein